METEGAPQNNHDSIQVELQATHDIYVSVFCICIFETCKVITNVKSNVFPFLFGIVEICGSSYLEGEQPRKTID